MKNVAIQRDPCTIGSTTAGSNRSGAQRHNDSKVPLGHPPKDDGSAPPRVYAQPRGLCAALPSLPALFPRRCACQHAGRRRGSGRGRGAVAAARGAGLERALQRQARAAGVVRGAPLRHVTAAAGRPVWDQGGWGGPGRRRNTVVVAEQALRCSSQNNSLTAGLAVSDGYTRQDPTAIPEVDHDSGHPLGGGARLVVVVLCADMTKQPADMTNLTRHRGRCRMSSKRPQPQQYPAKPTCVVLPLLVPALSSAEAASAARDSCDPPAGVLDSYACELCPAAACSIAALATLRPAPTPPLPHLIRNTIDKSLADPHLTTCVASLSTSGRRPSSRQARSASCCTRASSAAATGCCPSAPVRNLQRTGVRRAGGTAGGQDFS